MDFYYSLSIFNIFFNCLPTITSRGADSVFDKMVGNITLYFGLSWNFTNNGTTLQTLKILCLNQII